MLKSKNKDIWETVKVKVRYNHISLICLDYDNSPKAYKYGSEMSTKNNKGKYGKSRKFDKNGNPIIGKFYIL